jgi:hypothetical protein
LGGGQRPHLRMPQQPAQMGQIIDGIPKMMKGTTKCHPRKLELRKLKVPAVGPRRVALSIVASKDARILCCRGLQGTRELSIIIGICEGVPN